MPQDARLSPAETARAWHAVSPSETAEALKTDRERGLDPGEAEQRQQDFERNRLPRRGRKGVVAIFLRQFRDPLIYILLPAGGVSLALGNLEDAGFILAVLLFNAGLSTYQEYRVADVRLLAAGALQADESLLTGESSSVEKSADADLEPVTFATWATLLAVTLSKFFVVEAYKHLRGRRLAERLLRGREAAFSTA